jgi:hypothetical protein
VCDKACYKADEQKEQKLKQCHPTAPTPQDVICLCLGTTIQ